VVALGPAALRTVYGDSYRGTGPVLLVLTIAFPILPLTNLARALLIGLGRLRFWLWSAAAATAVNLALDVLLVPRLDAIGAAAANSGAQLAAGLPILAYAMRLAGPVSWDFAGACRTAIAAAAAGGAAWAVLSAVGGAAGLLAGVVAFGLTLTALARLLRVLLGDDARWIEDAAGARLGGFVARAARPPSRPS
jgi:O-antigen/teichoic acid export membrane protein